MQSGRKEEIAGRLNTPGQTSGSLLVAANAIAPPHGGLDLLSHGEAAEDDFTDRAPAFREAVAVGDGRRRHRPEFGH